MKKLSIIIATALLTLSSCQQNKQEKMNDTAKTEHYTFELSDKVTRQKVTFKNRYGIT
ncbi:MAG: lipoprotein, partial [Microscillaceae bacterium]|nr:lipoprotein [Microscillaceae bacterium]MDW8460829.1 lipoprotein [Cytophagales bacterium]